MPFKTKYGTHYHKSPSCPAIAGREIESISNTGGLEPCELCYGSGGSDGSGSLGGGAGAGAGASGAGVTAGSADAGEFTVPEDSSDKSSGTTATTMEEASQKGIQRGNDVIESGLPGMQDGASTPDHPSVEEISQEIPRITSFAVTGSFAEGQSAAFIELHEHENGYRWDIWFPDETVVSSPRDTNYANAVREVFRELDRSSDKDQQSRTGRKKPYSIVSDSVNGISPEEDPSLQPHYEHQYASDEQRQDHMLQSMHVSSDVHEALRQYETDDPQKVQSTKTAIAELLSACDITENPKQDGNYVSVGPNATEALVAAYLHARVGAFEGKQDAIDAIVANHTLRLKDDASADSILKYIRDTLHTTSARRNKEKLRNLRGARMMDHHTYGSGDDAYGKELGALIASGIPITRDKNLSGLQDYQAEQAKEISSLPAESRYRLWQDRAKTAISDWKETYGQELTQKVATGRMTRTQARSEAQRAMRELRAQSIREQGRRYGSAYEAAAREYQSVFDETLAAMFDERK